jgi:hypothetical protein
MMQSYGKISSTSALSAGRWLANLPVGIHKGQWICQKALKNYLGVYYKMEREHEQLEKLSNSELQKLYAKDLARGRVHVWQKRSHKQHLENLQNLHKQSRK